MKKQVEHDEKLTAIYTNGGIYALCNYVTANMQLSTIVDLGAHYGTGYKLFGIQHPNADYIMVEPVNECVQQIKNVIDSNPTAKIRLINGIIGLHSGITEIKTFTNDRHQSSNLFSNRGGVYGATSCEVIKIYSYDVMPPVIDFAKINIEGAEYQLIDDGFFNRIDTFVMEVHNGLVQGKSYIDVINALGNNFILTTCGNREYKYCFCIGHRI